eukprot:2223785-Rhodomonas_salina.1
MILDLRQDHMRVTERVTPFPPPPIEFRCPRRALCGVRTDLVRLALARSEMGYAVKCIQKADHSRSAMCGPDSGYAVTRIRTTPSKAACSSSSG